MDSIIQSNVRPLRSITPYGNISKDIIDYAAGFMDTDGSYATNNVKNLTTISMYVKIGQAERGIAALHFMYDNFGGTISLQKKASGNHQTAYDWILLNSDAMQFINLIVQSATLKKREALALQEFPLANTHEIPILARNTNTGETEEIENLKIAAARFRKNLAFKNQSIIEFDDWILKKKLNEDDIKTIRDKRTEIHDKLKEFKKTPHDDISDTFVPSFAYIAGICDGEACLQVHGKSGVHIQITQKYTPILNMMKRIYGGSVHFRKGNDTWGWEIYSLATELLKSIAPFMVGKKKQVDLILNMKQGEAPQVHLKLRELKGNCGATPRIEAIRDGEPQYTTDVKKLPKGVFPLGHSETRFLAQIQYKRNVYRLGAYDDPDEAHERYIKYKRAIELEKRGGPAVDFSDLREPTTR